MSKASLQTLKGFRDFLPEDMKTRSEVVTRITKVFQKYGFTEIQTPALEYQEVLLGKYGDEAEKLMYLFEDQGNRKVGLRYDLTVPLSRFISTHKNELIFPFKTYRIQPVWRAENTQKGRYRELYQCDFDIIDSSSQLADAEIVAILYDAFKSLGFMAFKININNRAILFDCLKSAKIPKEKEYQALQAIDKLDKKSVTEVEKELHEKGIGSKQSSVLFKKINEAKPDETVENILRYCAKLGISRNLVFSPSLVRGLNYYTGPIFEVTVDEPKIGSIAGGGRYDNLIKDLGGPNLPATGASIGLDRVCDVIKDSGLWKDIPIGYTKVLVTIFSETQTDASIQIANLLRTSGLETEIYLNTNDKLPKQLKYADRKNFDWVIILGPNETLKNEVVLKNLKTKKQETISVSAILSKIK
jgi:histidyl-tRNA synthetase